MFPLWKRPSSLATENKCCCSRPHFWTGCPRDTRPPLREGLSSSARGAGRLLSQGIGLELLSTLPIQPTRGPRHRQGPLFSRKPQRRCFPHQDLETSLLALPAKPLWREKDGPDRISPLGRTTGSDSGAGRKRSGAALIVLYRGEGRPVVRHLVGYVRTAKGAERVMMSRGFTILRAPLPACGLRRSCPISSITSQAWSQHLPGILVRLVVKAGSRRCF